MKTKKMALKLSRIHSPPCRQNQTALAQGKEKKLYDTCFGFNRVYFCNGLRSHCLNDDTVEIFFYNFFPLFFWHTMT